MSTFKKVHLSAKWILLIAVAGLLLAGCEEKVKTNTVYVEVPPSGTDTGGTQVVLCPGIDPGTDSDGDGLSDCVERQGWPVHIVGEVEPYVAVSDPTLPDTDGDGLTDFEEMAAGSDPDVADTDGDTLTDFEEQKVYASSPVDIDTDRDTLRDGIEALQFRTSPALADTDGDGVTDDVEITTTGFNPLVAELPKIDISVSTAPTLTLNATVTSDSSSTSYEASLQSRSDTTSRSASSSTETTSSESTTVGSEAGGSFPGGVSAKVSAEKNWSSSTTSTNSSSWSAESTAASQQEFQNTVTESSSVTFNDGTINVGFTLTNTGEKAVTVKNLKIAVLKRNVFNLNAQPRLITELVPRAGTEEVFDIANGASKGPLLATDTTVPGLVMQNLLADPRGLDFVVSAFDFTDPNLNLNYTVISEDTVGRTAVVVIDFGDGTVERFMVATSVIRDELGNSVGLTMAEVMGILDIPYTTAVQSRPPAPDKNVLASVRGVAIDPATFTIWFVATSSASVDDPNVNFEDIVVKSRDIIRLIYVKDTDSDGLIDRHELVYGTGITNPDTDGDGVSDGDEVTAGTDPIGVVANANALALTGFVSTVVTGLNAPQFLEYGGDQIYVSDFGANSVTRVDPATGTRTFLSNVFTNPQDLVTDGTYLYVADFTVHSIKKLELATNTVTLLAGGDCTTCTGATDGSAAAARFFNPVGMALAGNFLYVATADHLIRRVDKTTGATTTVAGLAGFPGNVDGFGANARFNVPEGIVTDGVHLFVSEKVGQTIRKVKINTGEVTTLAGRYLFTGSVDGPAGVATFSWPADLASDGTYLWLADRNNHVIRRVDIITGDTTTLTGAKTVSGFADGTGALFNFPSGIATDGIFLYVGDRQNGRIRRVE